MGNSAVKAHEEDDRGPTLFTHRHHAPSYTSDSDTEGKVSALYSVE